MNSVNSTLLLQEISQPIIRGDINIPWNLLEHTDTRRMREILCTFNLVKEIEFPTHKAGNALDWIIHKEELNSIHILTKLEFLSDHCIIEWTMRKAPLISEKIENKCNILKSVIFHCVVMLCYYTCTMYLYYSHMHVMMEPSYDIIGKTL